MLLDTNDILVTLPFTSSNDDWILINNEFTQFYRVNYDEHNWNLLAHALVYQPERFLLLDRVRLINDFCFLNTLGLVNNADGIRRSMLHAVHRNPAMFPVSHAYTTACQPSHNHT